MVFLQGLLLIIRIIIAVYFIWPACSNVQAVFTLVIPSDTLNSPDRATGLTLFFCSLELCFSNVNVHRDHPGIC